MCVLPNKSLSIIALSLLAVFSIVSVIGLVAPATIRSSAASCPSSKTISIVLEPIPTSFNLLAPGGDSSFAIASLEYLSLTPSPVEPNGSLDWSQSLANWMISNTNYTQWTFHVRPGATWSNGTAVTAQDVVTWASPAYALNPQYDFVGVHNEVASVRAVNSDTVVFNLNVSDAQFPTRISALYYSPVVSPTDVAKGPSNQLFGTAIADGPWYMANYTSGSTTGVMYPNPYWPGQKAAACAIDVVFVENSAEMAQFLVSNQADFAGELAFGNVASLLGHSNIVIHPLNGGAGNFMMYNITSYPYNMTAFRQALAYSINSSAIVQKSEFGYGLPANSAQGEIPSSVPYYTPNQSAYPYNVSKALELLHSIGFTGGGSTTTPLRFPNGTAMSVSVYTDSSKAWDPNVALQVAGFLKQLGMTVQTQTLTVQNLQSDYASNANNIRNNLVIYSSFGPLYFSPWVDAQQGCAVMGTPGCYGWFATPSPSSPSGQTQWLYPASADAMYQSNLSAITNTPPTNITGETHYLNNIQSLNAKYLQIIMLSYPDELFAYNTAKWTSWPSYEFTEATQFNVTIFSSLQPASTSTPTSTTLTTGSSTLTSSLSTTTGTSSTQSTTTTSKTSTGIAYPGIGVLVVIVSILLAGLAFLRMRGENEYDMRN